MTAGFPCSAVIMELSTYMRRISMTVVAGWSPRAANNSAGTSTNGDSRAFDPVLMHCRWEGMLKNRSAGCTAESVQGTEATEARGTVAGIGSVVIFHDRVKTDANRAPLSLILVALAFSCVWAPRWIVHVVWRERLKCNRKRRFHPAFQPFCAEAHGRSKSQRSLAVVRLWRFSILLLRFSAVAS